MAEKKESTAVTRSGNGGFSSLFSLRDQFDRMFDSMMRGWPAPWRDAPRLDLGNFDFAPRVDTAETDTAYEVTAELPGVDEKDVKISIEDDVLCIAGEKKSEREEKKKDYVMSERSYGSFKRAFTLPDNVDVDKIAAKYDKGVLKVTLPKTTPSPAKHREIPIKS
ncbi:MAG TPA: Hsp20/alpha crystallin family protein [Alphaproteobacteria bacterium]|jgi:HSP20 family protein